PAILLMAIGFCSAAQPVLPQKHEEPVAKMEKLPWGDNVLWRDPGDVASLDLENGVGGIEMQPRPPFMFVKEDPSGSNPKVFVKDQNGRNWNVKWSKEAHSDVFGSRMAFACGFISQPEYFVGQGQIRGIDKPLKRAASELHGDG